MIQATPNQLLELSHHYGLAARQVSRVNLHVNVKVWLYLTFHGAVTYMEQSIGDLYTVPHSSHKWDSNYGAIQ